MPVPVSEVLKILQCKNLIFDGVPQFFEKKYQKVVFTYIGRLWIGFYLISNAFLKWQLKSLKSACSETCAILHWDVISHIICPRVIGFYLCHHSRNLQSHLRKLLMHLRHRRCTLTLVGVGCHGQWISVSVSISPNCFSGVQVYIMSQFIIRWLYFNMNSLNFFLLSSITFLS